MFKEIKGLRRAPQAISTSIDGISENVPDHFGSIYSALYNSADDGFELKKVQQHVESLVDSSGLDTVSKITPEVVKSAAEKLKSGKSDPVFSFSSDCFKTLVLTFLYISQLS